MPALPLKITDAGRAALRNEDGTGTRAVVISRISVGRDSYSPTAQQTQLRNPIKDVPTFGGASVDAYRISVSIQDQTRDEYAIGEIGLWTDDDVLFAVFSRPGDPIINKAAGADLLINAALKFVDVDVTNVQFGNTEFVNPVASETRAGVIYIATEQEAADLENDEDAMTPAKTGVAIESFFDGAEGAGPGKNLNSDQLDDKEGEHYEQYIGAKPINPQFSINNLAGGWYSIGDTKPRDCPVSNATLWQTQGEDGVRHQMIVAAGVVITRRRPRADAAWQESTLWTSGNQGPDSGANADLLDGMHASEVAQKIYPTELDGDDDLLTQTDGWYYWQNSPPQGIPNGVPDSSLGVALVASRSGNAADRVMTVWFRSCQQTWTYTSSGNGANRYWQRLLTSNDAGRQGGLTVQYSANADNADNAGKLGGREPSAYAKANGDTSNFFGVRTAVGSGNAVNNERLEAFMVETLKRIYPVGRAFLMQDDSRNPADILGFGTWELRNQGRSIFGHGTNREGTRYTAGDRGGNETIRILSRHMPSHYHMMFWDGDDNDVLNQSTYTVAAEGDDLGDDYRYRMRGRAGSSPNVGRTSSEGEGQPINAVPPYEVWYIWKRTA